MILSRFWQGKKAFSFAIVIGAILLATTKVEAILADYIVKAGGSFDPIGIRVGSCFVISVIFLYYAIIRDS